MRKLSALVYLAFLLPAITVLASCTADRGAAGGETETVEQGFAAGTRTGLNGDPRHGDAFTMISYNVGGTSSNDNYKNQISEARQFGYYAYDDGMLSGREEGTLVPVAVSAPGVNDLPPFSSATFYKPSAGINPLTIDRNQGQRLFAAAVGGPNPTTNQGLYRTAVIYPAVPMISSGNANLGYLAVFHIGTDVWASSPDDADGDPGTYDPFEILVNTNRMIHQLPDPTELFHIKSAVKVWFYSEYFSDNDPDMLTPLTQTFTINSLKLVNVGSNGWFNARTGIVYPNYNYGILPVTGATAGQNWRTFYSAEEIGVNPDGTPLYPARGAYNFTDLLDPDHNGSSDDSLVEDESGNDILPPPRPGFPAPTKFIQWSAETPVFPSDYRGAENGGLTQVMPLSLRMELNIYDAPLKATVPIALLMERGKRYNFYVNVMSEMIRIGYTVSAWGAGGGSGPIGGNMSGYMDLDIEYRPGGWVIVGGGSEDIGN